MLWNITMGNLINILLLKTNRYLKVGTTKGLKTNVRLQSYPEAQL